MADGADPVQVWVCAVYACTSVLMCGASVMMQTHTITYKYGWYENSADPDHLGLCCLYMLFCPNMWGHCGDVNSKYMIKMRVVWQIVRTLGRCCLCIHLCLNT